MHMGEKLGQQLRIARKAKGLTIKAVADHLGISPAAVSQWEAGTTEPSRDNLAAVAALLELDLFQLMIDTHTSNMAQDLMKKIKARRERTNVAPNPEAPALATLQGLARDVPILGTAVGGSDGDFRLNGSENDRAVRPPGLANTKGVFALYTMNDSMYPAWKENALFYVNPNRKPVVGDDVVVELHSNVEGEPGAAFLKRLKARRGKKIVVEQFNPPAELEFDADTVTLYRVVPWEEALGFS